MDNLYELLRIWLEAVGGVKIVEPTLIPSSSGLLDIIKIEKCHNLDSFVNQLFPSFKSDSPILSASLTLVYAAFSENPACSRLRTEVMYFLDTNVQLAIQEFLRCFNEVDFKDIDVALVNKAAELIPDIVSVIVTSPREGTPPRMVMSPLEGTPSRMVLSPSVDSPLQRFFQTKKRRFVCKHCGNGELIKQMQTQMEEDETERNQLIQAHNNLKSDLEKKLARELCRNDNLAAKLLDHEINLAEKDKLIKSLEDKCQENFRSLSFFEEDLKYTQKCLTETTSRLTFMEKEHAHVVNQLKETEEKYAETLSSLDDFIGKKTELEIMLEARCSAYSELEENYLALKRMDQSLEPDFDSSLHQWENLGDELLLAARLENSELLRKLETAEENHKRIVNDLENTHSSAMVQLTEKHHEEKIVFDKLHSKILQDLEQCKEQVQKMETEKSALHAENVQLTSTIKCLEMDISALKLVTDKYAEEKVALSELHTIAIENLKKSQSELQRTVAEKLKLLAENEELQDMIKAKIDEISALEKTMKENELVIRDHLSSLEHSLSDNDALRSEQKRLQDLLEAANNELADLKLKLLESEQQREENGKRLEADVEELKWEMARLEEKYAEEKMELDELYAKALENLGNAQSELQQTEAEKLKLHAENEELQDVIKTKSDEISALEKMMKENELVIRDHVSSLEHSLSNNESLRSEQKRLQDLLEASNNELADLKIKLLESEQQREENGKRLKADNEELKCEMARLEEKYAEEKMELDELYAKALENLGNAQSELQQTEAEKLKLHAENEELQDVIKTKSDEISALEKMMKENELVIRNHVSSLEHSLSNNESLRSEQKRLQDLLEASNNELADLKIKLLESEQQREENGKRLKADNEELKCEMARLEEKYAEEKMELDELYAKALENLGNAQSELQQTEAEKLKLLAENEELQDMIKAKTDEISALEKTMKENEIVIRDHLSSLEHSLSDNDALRSEQKRLQDLLEAANNELADLKLKLLESEQQREENGKRLEADVEEFKCEMARLEEKYAEEKMELDELYAKALENLGNAQSELQRTEAEKLKLLAENEELQGMIKAKTDEISSLEKTMKENEIVIRDHLSSLEHSLSDNDALRSEQKRLQDLLEAANNELADLKLKLLESEQQREENGKRLGADVEELKWEMARLEEKYAEEKMELDELYAKALENLGIAQSKLQRTEAEKLKLHAENEELQDMIKAKTDEISALKKKIQENESILRQKLSALENSESGRELLRSELKKSEDLLQASAADLSKLQEKLKKLEVENEVRLNENNELTRLLSTEREKQSLIEQQAVEFNREKMQLIAQLEMHQRESATAMRHLEAKNLALDELRNVAMAKVNELLYSHGQLRHELDDLVANKSAENAKLGLDVNEARSKCQNLADDLAHALTDVESFKNYVRDLKKQRDRMLREIEEKNLNYKNLEKDYQAMENRTLSLAEINSRLSTEIMKAKSLSSEELAMYESEVTSLKSTVSQLNQKVEELSMARREVEEQFQNAVKENRELINVFTVKLASISEVVLLKDRVDKLLASVKISVPEMLTVVITLEKRSNHLLEKFVEAVRGNGHFDAISRDLKEILGDLDLISAKKPSVEDLSDSLEEVPVQEKTFQIINLHEDTFTMPPKMVEKSKSVVKESLDEKRCVWTVSPPSKKKQPLPATVKKERCVNGESWVIPVGPAPAKPARKTEPRSRSNSTSSTHSLPAQPVHKASEDLIAENKELRSVVDELERKLQRERENFEDSRNAIRQKYEKQLDHMKDEMKNLYNQEITKHKSEQSKMADELKRKNEELKKQNAAYKEDIDDLRSHLWSLSDKLLANEQTTQKREEDRMDPSRQFDRINLQSVDSWKSGITCGESSGIDASSRQQRFPSMPVEDEEEIFDSRCLEDLKAGRLTEQDRQARLTELRIRNSLCLPHLRSSYPVETQFLSPPICKESDLKSTFISSEGPSSTDSSDPSMTKSLLPSEKNKKKEQPSYKRPGPPTPSKNGRPSLGGEVKLTPKRPLREQNQRGTPSRLKALFSSKNNRRESFGGHDENVAPSTPRGKGLRIFQRKPFGGRDF